MGNKKFNKNWKKHWIESGILRNRDEYKDEKAEKLETTIIIGLPKKKKYGQSIPLKDPFLNENLENGNQLHQTWTCEMRILQKLLLYLAKLPNLTSLDEVLKLRTI